MMNASSRPAPGASVQSLVSAVLRWGATLLAAALLTACGGMRLVDTDVTAFAVWPISPPATGTAYRFERLPSQQPQAGQTLGRSEMSQDQLEAAAQTVLGRYGLVNNPGAATLDVQVSGTSYLSQPGYNNGFYGGSGVSIGGGTGGGFVGFSVPLMRMEPTLYNRELAVIIRDSRTRAVVFETRARHNGIWGDSQVVFPAMLDAAMQGFPRPPAGPRRVNVEVPR